MSNVTLLGQAQQIINLAENIDDPENEIKFNELLTDHKDKIDNCVHYIQHTEYTIDWLKSEKKHIDQQIKKLEYGIERMKQRAQEVMTMTNQKELLGAKGHKFREQLYESLEITNLDLIPEKYKSTEIKINVDKTELKSALKRGELIEGIELKLNPRIIVK